MKEHKSKLERQMAKENENSKRDIVCEVKLNNSELADFRFSYSCL